MLLLSKTIKTSKPIGYQGILYGSFMKTNQGIKLSGQFILDVEDPIRKMPDGRVIHIFEREDEVPEVKWNSKKEKYMKAANYPSALTVKRINKMYGLGHVSSGRGAMPTEEYL